MGEFIKVQLLEYSIPVVFTWKDLSQSIELLISNFLDIDYQSVYLHYVVLVGCLTRGLLIGALG